MEFIQELGNWDTSDSDFETDIFPFHLASFGNFMVLAWAVWGDETTSATTVSDDAGNSWQFLNPVSVDSDFIMGLAWARVDSGSPGTVTIQWSSGGGFTGKSGTILEFSGDFSGNVDQTIDWPSHSDSTITETIDTVSGNALLIGAVAQEATENTITPDPGWEFGSVNFNSFAGSQLDVWWLDATPNTYALAGSLSASVYRVFYADFDYTPGGPPPPSGAKNLATLGVG